MLKKWFPEALIMKFNNFPEALIMKFNNLVQGLGLQPDPVHVPIEAEVAIKNRIFQDFSKDYGLRNGHMLRKLEFSIDAKHLACNVQKLSPGNVSPNRETKINMLLGETGTGKTTLINAMANFICGVEFEDDWRLILVDDCDAPKRSLAESQTDLITAFVFNYINGMPFEYNYVLIDTPGFGDTKGIARDRELMAQIESFLKQDYGIDQVDGIGIVTPASAARLTPTQRYVFDGISSMLGADFKDNINIMATFADTTEPPVVAALKDAEVHYNGFYKFNNSAIYANNAESSQNGAASYLNWEMGNSSLRDFFLKLVKTIPVSLTLTKEVLEERRKLKTIISELTEQIQLCLSKLATLHQERNVVSHLK